MVPRFITFTGIDAQTDLDRVRSISKRFPCEWGILFSKNRQGLDNRYPPLDVIDAALGIGEISYAAHVCGKHAQNIMDGEYIGGTLPLDRFPRIQVNHVRPDVIVLADFALPAQTVIAQWRGEDQFPKSDTGISWLYDPSGGRGERPSVWPLNPSDKMVGYAGGITPDNVAAVNEKVGGLSPAGYWLDMESGVRTDDWLDLDKVEAVLMAVYG